MFTDDIERLIQSIEKSDKKQTETIFSKLTDTATKLFDENKECSPLKCENCKNKVSCRLISQIHFIALAHHNKYLTIFYTGGYDVFIENCKTELQNTCNEINETYYNQIYELISSELIFDCTNTNCERCVFKGWCGILLSIFDICKTYETNKR